MEQNHRELPHGHRVDFCRLAIEEYVALPRTTAAANNTTIARTFSTLRNMGFSLHERARREACARERTAQSRLPSFAALTADARQSNGQRRFEASAA